MSKKIKKLCAAVALAALVGVSTVAFPACGTSKHPTAKITIEFNEETYVIEYMLYRNMYPKTVQHFIELADEGFYNNMIVHNYTESDWITGGYSYNGIYYEYDSAKGEEVPIETKYSDSFSSSLMADYLDRNNKESAYYDLANKGAFSASVYKGSIPDFDDNGDAKISSEYALPTVIGEFSANNHKIEDNKGLTADYGTLKMFYYKKDGDSVFVKNSFNQILYADYSYNCATSLFALQVNPSSAYNANNYAVFGKLKNDKAQDHLEDLTDAISDYVDYISSLNSSSTWKSTVATKVDKLDTYADDGGRDIDQNFTMTSMPIIIRSVKITKH